LWTHTPVDWRGNENGQARPGTWPPDAINGSQGAGTRPGEQMPPPGLTVLSATAGAGQATVTWTTSVASDSSVDIGPTTAYGTHVNDPALVTSHSVVVVTGTHGVLQHYRASSTGNGYSIVSADSTVTPT